MNKRLILFFFFSYLCAQNTSLNQSVLSSGAIKAESDQTKLVGTIGQVFTQKVMGPNTILASGFWGSVSQITLGVDNDVIPEEFSISTAYPNPFNPVITLSYFLASDGFVNITIYDMMGRKINILENGPQTAGHTEVQWNAMNDRGQVVSAGVYLYKIQVGDKMDTRKIVLLK